ncbi:MAG: hypothetical protein AAFX78_02630 [Cyanobacteria bacterium J06638_20]
MSEKLPSFHSDLTPAEVERLSMLAEECGEVVQAVGKILRHGFESYHPDDLFKGRPTPDAVSNRGRLQLELADVLAMCGHMENDGDVQISTDDIENAMIRKGKYAHHQEW